MKRKKRTLDQFSHAALTPRQQKQAQGGYRKLPVGEPRITPTRWGEIDIRFRDNQDDDDTSKTQKGGALGTHFTSDI